MELYKNCYRCKTPMRGIALNMPDSKREKCEECKGNKTKFNKTNINPLSKLSEKNND